ncbi:glutamate mutase L, partial [Candidatus Fermentibacterales bacterium]|nr:glutamate mutase L [Candidatus Fermentibacterales bacterium]
VILHTMTLDSRGQAAERMGVIRKLRPDMILMAGGIEGGAIAGVVAIAELLDLSDPEPRYAGPDSHAIPLVFCGNSDAVPFVRKVLHDSFELHVVENVRPGFEQTNQGPAREKIHELFMRNVMERAPGFSTLRGWVSDEIMPTPAAVARTLGLVVRDLDENVLLMDMGGATTDIFSNISGDYHRTVSANTGMSYSMSHVLEEAGLDAILAHLEAALDPAAAADYMMNKTLCPTYRPVSAEEHRLELAVATEAARIAWRQHVSMSFEVVRLGFLDRMRRRTRDRFEQTFSSDALAAFRLSDVDRIIAAGGIVRASTPEDVLRLVADGFHPPGLTRVSADTRFKSPHMGILSRHDPDSASRLFREDCLKDVGYVVAPLGKPRKSRVAMRVLRLTPGKEGREVALLRAGEHALLERGGDIRIEVAQGWHLGQERRTLEISTDLPVLLDCRGRTRSGEPPPLPLFPTPSGKQELVPESPLSALGAARDERIATGAFEIDRDLPYEGDILVEPGDLVHPGTVIGENRFAPRWLYMIDLNRVTGYSQPLSREQVSAGLQVAVGDEVRLGQTVFSLRVSGGILGQVLSCRSPVRGEVTGIETSAGLIVLREIQDYDGRPHVIDVAGPLGIKPRRIAGSLTVRPGDFVATGQAVARDTSAGVFVRSPSAGTVRKIDRKRGTVTIQYDVRPVPVLSHLKGEVVRVRPGHGATVRASGTVLKGRIGFGSERSGPMVPLDGARGAGGLVPGSIVLTTLPVTRDTLELCSSSAAGALIGPSMRALDLFDFLGHPVNAASTGQEEVPFAILLTRGFGCLDMDASVFGRLMASAGSNVAVFPATQVRAGVIRPRLLVQDDPEG